MLLCNSTRSMKSWHNLNTAAGPTFRTRPRISRTRPPTRSRRSLDQVEGYANDAMDKLRDTGAGEVAGNLKGAVDKSVKDQPMATLALAAAVGFVLGAIWKA